MIELHRLIYGDGRVVYEVQDVIYSNGNVAYVECKHTEYLGPDAEYKCRHFQVIYATTMKSIAVAWHEHYIRIKLAEKVISDEVMI